MNTIIRKGKIICANYSPYAICMEHINYFRGIINLDKLSSLSCENHEKSSFCPSNSKIQEQVTRVMTTETGGRGVVVISIRTDFTELGQSKNPKGSSLTVKHVIDGISVLGISYILYFLYKVNISTF